MPLPLISAFQVYNVSANSQPIHLIVDQDDNDDFSEKEHTAVSYTSASSRYEYPQDSYDIELAWKDENNELEQVYATKLSIQDNYVNFIVVAEDIKNPRVEIYEITHTVFMLLASLTAVKLFLLHKH